MKKLAAIVLLAFAASTSAATFRGDGTVGIPIIGHNIGASIAPDASDGSIVFQAFFVANGNTTGPWVDITAAIMSGGGHQIQNPHSAVLFYIGAVQKFSRISFLGTRTGTPPGTPTSWINGTSGRTNVTCGAGATCGPVSSTIDTNCSVWSFTPSWHKTGVYIGSGNPYCDDSFTGAPGGYTFAMEASWVAGKSKFDASFPGAANLFWVISNGDSTMDITNFGDDLLTISQMKVYP